MAQWRFARRGRSPLFGVFMWPGTVLLVLLLLAVLPAGLAGYDEQGTAPGSAAGGPSSRGAADFDVRAENARPGADCGLARLGQDHAVEGGWTGSASHPVSLFGCSLRRQRGS